MNKQDPEDVTIDPDDLLPQLHVGLDSLKASQIELVQQEQQLLAEASQHYEQLKTIAGELARVRQQQAVTSQNVEKILDALHLLERRQIPEQPADQIDPPRPESLVIQAEA